MLLKNKHKKSVYKFVVLIIIASLNVNLSYSQCTFSVSPDLPLLASSTEIENEINKIYNKYSDDYLGTAAPSSFKLSNAVTSYNSYNIVVSGNNISGNTISNLGELNLLKIFAKHLKQHPSDTDISTKANNIIWLASKQICEGNLDVDLRGYDYRNFGKSAILLKTFLTKEVQDLFRYSLYKTTNNFIHFWKANYNETHQQANDAIDTDMIYNKSSILIAYVFWQDSPEEKYRYMRAFKRYMERFFSYSVGTTNGIKKDGSGFHHWTAYNNYMYAYNTAIDCVSYLDGTRFQVSETNYKIFRDAIFTQLLQANDFGVQALSTAGRKPHVRVHSLSESSIKSLAISGGEILGLSTADPFLAGFYNRAFGIDSNFNYNSVSPFEEGFVQLNHANAGFFRKINWIAFTKGFTNGLWGAETYSKNNRYGRYQSYGALEVLYQGNKENGNGYNETTWDWNYNPGTTVIKLPWSKLHSEKERIDERQQKNFAGSLMFRKKQSEYLEQTYGTFGMFAMDFQEMENQGFGTTYSSNNHNESFKFKKSNFFFDDFIICLGSGISNDDTSNKTITTLFQRIDNKVITPIINGANTGSFGEFNYDGNINNWLISNYKTGFYVFSNNENSIKLKKSIQQNPNHNQIWPATYSGNPKETYYLGYIDHGTNPLNKTYEYILKPNTTSSEMQSLHTAISRGNKPYVVHQQDSNAHVLEHKSKDIFGYSVFTELNNLSLDKIKSVNKPCLLMTEYNSNSKELSLSISNPELEIASRSYQAIPSKTVDVILNGQWDLNSNNSDINLISSNSIETIIQFTLRDGLSLELVLNKSSLSVDDFEANINEIKIYPNPSQNTINIQSEIEINEIELFSILGKKILLSKINRKENYIKLDLSVLLGGFYIIKIETDRGVTSKRIIVEK